MLEQALDPALGKDSESWEAMEVRNHHCMPDAQA